MSVPQTTEEIVRLWRPSNAQNTEVDVCRDCAGSGYRSHPDDPAGVCGTCGGQGGIEVSDIVMTMEPDARDLAETLARRWYETAGNPDDRWFAVSSLVQGLIEEARAESYREGLHAGYNACNAESGDD